MRAKSKNSQTGESTAIIVGSGVGGCLLVGTAVLVIKSKLAATAQVAAESAAKVNESQMTINNQTQVDQEVIRDKN